MAALRTPSTSGCTFLQATLTSALPHHISQGRLPILLIARVAIARKGDYDRAAALLDNYLTTLAPRVDPEVIRAHQIERVLRVSLSDHVVQNS
jgi:hypothetical protein